LINYQQIYYINPPPSHLPFSSSEWRESWRVWWRGGWRDRCSTCMQSYCGNI